MQNRYYDKEKLNKLIVVNKPMFISSNAYLNRIKRKYKNKKAGFSGTLDPFAKGTLIVAFGQYSKLFPYLKKTSKRYRAVIWFGVQSDSFDIENVNSIELINKLEFDEINKTVNQCLGEIEYTPPKYSAKKIDGVRAYELARAGLDVNMKKSIMNIYDIKLINYNHPFLNFEVEVSEGSYIRSLAQIICEKLSIKGTLSYLERLNEGDFYFDNEKELNPLDYLDLPQNKYLGSKKWLEYGKKISLDFLEKKDEGKYLIILEDFFSIIEIKENDVKYLLNKVEINV